MANNAARYWCFTVNNENEVYETFRPHWDAGFDTPKFREDCQYLVYQFEHAPNTRRVHIQGFWIGHKRLRFGQIQTILGCPTAHFEVMRGKPDQARAYCMKDTNEDGTQARADVYDREGLEDRPRSWEWGLFVGTFKGRRTDYVKAREEIHKKKSWSEVINDGEIANVVAPHLNWAREVYNNRPIEVPAPDIELRPWQLEVIGMLDGPPVKRRIIWIWSAESATGKSTFYDYCSRKYKVLPAKDFSNTLYAWDGHEILWWDLSRWQQNEGGFPYHNLELFSNLTVHLSTKYSSTPKYVNSHVVVTANSPPDEEKLPQRFVVIYATPVVQYGPQPNPNPVFPIFRTSTRTTDQDAPTKTTDVRPPLPPQVIDIEEDGEYWRVVRRNYHNNSSRINDI